MPKRFIKAFLESIALEDKNVNKLFADEVQKLQVLKNYHFSPAGTFGFARAEASKGGVLTQQINPITFEALEVEGLYFLGEVLDVTGELGGYNFQWAFSSAMSCAKYL